jgi:hypothetical protein
VDGATVVEASADEATLVVAATSVGDAVILVVVEEVEGMLGVEGAIEAVVTVVDAATSRLTGGDLTTDSRTTVR